MSAVTAQALHELLAREGELGGRLLAVLERESGALGRRDTAEMESAVAEKGTLLQMLEQCAEQRRRHLQESGLTADREGFDALLARLEDDELLAQWGEVRQTLDRCRQQNQANGIAVENSRHTVQKALAILLGGDNDQPGLYNHRGVAGPAHLGSRSHAKA